MMWFPPIIEFSTEADALPGLREFVQQHGNSKAVSRPPPFGPSPIHRWSVERLGGIKGHGFV